MKQKSMFGETRHVSSPLADVRGETLDSKGLYRVTDPETSKEAADDISDEELSDRREEALEYVTRYPKSTTLELGSLWAANDRYKLMQCTRTFGKRVSELLNMGYIIDCGDRSPCQYSGRDTIRYVLTPKGHAAIKEIHVKKR